MINLALPLAAGTAVRLYLSLPDNGEFSRVLRKATDTFTGPTDPAALVVVDGFADNSIIDLNGLVNGMQVFYHCYDWISSAWVDSGASFPATPQTTYIDDALDPQELVRDRVQLGITAEVARGNLSPATGSIQVTTAPFALPDSVNFPTISVHLESTGPAERAMGDSISDYNDPQSGLWNDDNGWMARVSLTVAGVSLNPDERISLRKALRRVIQANLPIFADSGMILIEFQQTDSEQFTEGNAPLYFTNGAFSCVAPAFIRVTDGVITDVTVSETSIDPLTGEPYA